MKKIFKKFVLTVVAACLIITGVFAAACNPAETQTEDPAKDGYTITVLYPDGTPVKASDTGSNRRRVRVALYDESGKNVMPNYDKEGLGVLSDNGTTTLDYKIPGEYVITILNIPEGFDAPVTKTSADKSKYTVTLVTKKCSYDINVKLPDGNGANAYDVKLMNGESAIASGKTDASGKFSTPVIEAGIYDVVVTAPEGTNYNHKPLSTKRSGAAIEVKLFETTIITTDENYRMTDEQFDYWDERVNGSVITRISKDNDNYLFNAQTHGSEETFFILKAEKAGRYTMTLKSDEDEHGAPLPKTNYLIKFYVNNSFGQENDSMRLSGTNNNGNQSQVMSLKSGEIFIFSVSSLDGRENYSVDFVIAYSKEAVTTEAFDEGTFLLSFNDINEAVLAFKPPKSGKYQITSLSDTYDPRIVLYAFGPAYDEDGNLIGDDNSGEGKNFSYVEHIQESYTGNTYTYHIFIDSAITTNLSVKIERIGDADPEIVINVTEAEVKATLVKQEKQSGSWKWLDENDSVTEKDGKFFVNVDGSEKQVYVAIKKDIYDKGDVKYSFATVESLLPEGGQPPVGEDGSGASGGQPSTGGNGKLTVYEIGSRVQKYNYTNFVKTYAGYCNSYDGVYPMNEELKTFVERYMSNWWTDYFDNPDADNPPANLLQFACGYFA